MTKKGVTIQVRSDYLKELDNLSKDHSCPRNAIIDAAIGHFLSNVESIDVSSEVDSYKKTLAKTPWRKTFL